MLLLKNLVLDNYTDINHSFLLSNFGNKNNTDFNDENWLNLQTDIS